MSKHTQGPWSVGYTTRQNVDPRIGPFYETNIHVGPKENQGNLIAKAFLGGPGATSPIMTDVEANARLIAAAPDLLSVLKEALKDSGCDGDLCCHWWHEAARAAIAKAEGGAE